tara:strand:+ start:702 stop:872 length:171 start_codon:yes stop_codon:yes gene_type:complete
MKCIWGLWFDFQGLGKKKLQKHSAIKLERSFLANDYAIALVLLNISIQYHPQLIVF